VIGDLNDGLVLDTAGAITETGLAESSARVVPAGTVLIAMYGSIGKLGIAGIDMATNQAIAFATPSTALESKYLFWYLRSQRSYLRTAGKGATQKNISQTVLKAWPMPLPPLNEQRRIVAAIEEHLSRADVADASLVAAVKRAEAMRRAVLTTALGSISNRRPLGEVAVTQLGKMLSAKARTGLGTRPYLRNKNVQWGRIDTDDLLAMDFSERDAMKFELCSGDVLVCEGGEVGRAAVWHGDVAGCCFQKALHRVRVGEQLSPEFLVHVYSDGSRTGMHSSRSSQAAPSSTSLKRTCASSQFHSHRSKSNAESSPASRRNSRRSTHCALRSSGRSAARRRSAGRSSSAPSAASSSPRTRPTSPPTPSSPASAPSAKQPRPHHVVGARRALDVGPVQHTERSHERVEVHRSACGVASIRRSEAHRLTAGESC
jgi:type I restriction enzyme S subunit